MSEVGVIINVVSFNEEKQPHIASIYERGLWGFEEKTINRNRWEQLEKGTRTLIYGDGGISMAARIKKTEYSKSPILYWAPPHGYPLHTYLELLNTTTEGIEPITREELVNYAIGMFKVPRFSLVVFGDASKKGVTYPIKKFDRIWDLFLKRNKVRTSRP